LLTAYAFSQEGPSPLKAFYFRSTSNAVNTRDLFQWPTSTDIDAVMKVDVPATSTAQVLIALYVGTEVVGKFKSKYSLTPGVQELRIPKVFATDKILGQRLITAKLELAIKGYAVERREVTFEVQGPPQPKAEITNVRIYEVQQNSTPHTPRSSLQFGPGKPFMVEVEFNVSDNPAHIKPQLLVLMSMVEDDAYTGYDLERQTYDNHYDLKAIDLNEGEGKRRVVLQCNAPRMFANPWQNHHPFRVYAGIDFGNGQRVVKSADGEVFDYTPGEIRRSDDPARRLFTIARASSWTVSIPDPVAVPVDETHAIPAP
jgi:hypothetical protein